MRAILKPTSSFHLFCVSLWLSFALAPAQASSNTPYGDWVAYWTSQNPAFGSVSELSADPDNDGYPNSTEFAFDGDPMAPTAALLASVVSSNNLVVSFSARSTDPAGAAYQVQSSTNLEAGFVDATDLNVIEVSPDGILVPSQYHRVQFTVPLAGDRKFYRVRATPDYGAVYFASNPDGANSVVALTRDLSTGLLTYLGSFTSGGNGASAIQGAQAHAVMANGSFVYAVNSGSGSFSTFRIGQGGELTLIATTPSGGTRPVSIAIHGNLLFVLNQGISAIEQEGPVDAGVYPFILGTDGIPVAAAATGVSISAADAPSDVLFTGNGLRLAVMCSGTNAIRSYDVDASGNLSNSQLIDVGSQPVGGASNARLAWCGFSTVVEDPGAASVVSFNAEDALSIVSQVPAAADQDPCWATTDTGGFRLWTSNFLPRSLTLYSIASDGSLTRQGAYEPPAIDDGTGALDIGVSSDGRFLYRLRAFNQDGSPTPPHPFPVVEVFQITSDTATGDLTLIQSVQVSVESLRYASPSGMAVASP
jgi:6-phosphogluconolactonase (cycloisomerase 2 family)